MSDVITADDTVNPGSIGFSLVGARTMPAALQIASHRLEACALGCTSGKTMNPRITEATKIAATTAMLRTTQGSLRDSGASWIIAERQCRRQEPRRQAEGQVAQSGSRSW